MKKYMVKAGYTILTSLGTAHEGAILKKEHFVGMKDEDVKDLIEKAYKTDKLELVEDKKEEKKADIFIVKDKKEADKLEGSTELDKKEVDKSDKKKDKKGATKK